MSKTILLVDDDSRFRAQLLPLLAQRGYRVLEAARFADATALLTDKLDLVVVDGLLPDGDGAHWIKSLPAGVRKVPIVFVSAFWKSLKDHQMLQQELGVALIVHKPVAPESLTLQIDRLLGVTSAPKLDPEIQAEMDKLHAEYGDELPQKLEDLRQAIRRARAQPLEEKARKEARTLAHRLSGTAGSYGYPDESAAAAVIESQAISAATAAPAELDQCWAIAESIVTDAIAARRKR